MNTSHLFDTLKAKAVRERQAAEAKAARMAASKLKGTSTSEDLLNFQANLRAARAKAEAERLANLEKEQLEVMMRHCCLILLGCKGINEGLVLVITPRRSYVLISTDQLTDCRCM
jgi:hypothetical protein